MRLCIAILLGSTVCYFADSQQPPSGVLSAHNGVFLPLNLTPKELEEISTLHATANYHLLVKYIQERMDETDLTSSEREAIEDFLRIRKPPKVMSSFMNKNQREEVYRMFQAQQFNELLDIIEGALRTLEPADRYQATMYLWPHLDNEKLAYLGL